MKTKFILPAILLAAALAARAEEQKAKVEGTKPKFEVTTSPKAASSWNTSPAHWDQIISRKRETPELRIGKSDYKVSGVLIQGIRRQRSSADLSLGKKFLRLPVVSWFVPQPMPSPPGSGKYFRWGESDRPWVDVASGAAPGSDPAVTHEAKTSLISIQR